MMDYNVDVAKKFGLCSATFINLLQKSAILFSNNDIVLTREMIYDLTGLDEQMQKTVEKALIDCGVISVKNFKGYENKYHYILNNDRFVQILNSVVDDFTGCSIKYSNPNNLQAKSKKIIITNKLKNSVNVDDPILKQYIFDWIDSLYENKKSLTVKGLQLFLQDLMKYKDENSVDDCINVLKIAIKNGWKDIGWAMLKNNESKATDNSKNFANYFDIIA